MHPDRRVLGPSPFRYRLTVLEWQDGACESVLEANEHRRTGVYVI